MFIFLETLNTMDFQNPCFWNSLEISLTALSPPPCTTPSRQVSKYYGGGGGGGGGGDDDEEEAHDEL